MEAHGRHGPSLDDDSSALRECSLLPSSDRDRLSRGRDLCGRFPYPLDIPVAALYVVVVLMAARFLQPRAVMLVAAGCAGLTLLEAYLSPPPASGSFWVGAVNTLISLTGSD